MVHRHSHASSRTWTESHFLFSCGNLRDYRSMIKVWLGTRLGEFRPPKNLSNRCHFERALTTPLSTSWRYFSAWHWFASLRPVFSASRGLPFGNCFITSWWGAISSAVPCCRWPRWHANGKLAPTMVPPATLGPRPSSKPQC